MMIYLDISNTSYVSHSETSSQQQRGRSALKDRCVVVLGEFSEVYGPLALKIVPDDIEKSTREEISNFIVQVMAVDYTGTHAGVPTYSPADTSLLYQQTKSHISALVHYFNLHDVKARGYSRIFTLSFITLSPDCLFPNVNTIKSCFEHISKVCHDENLLQFHSEMLDKKVHFANDVIERRQIQWWLNEMERMYSLPSPAPDSPDDLDKVEGTATDDITLRPFSTYPAGDAGPKLVQSWRSLPSLLDQDPSNKYVKHIVKGKIQCGEGSLRGIAELVPIAYCYLQRSMVQLYKSKGTCGSLKKPCVKETPTLAIGRYSLQFPSPTFTSGVEGIASIDKKEERKDKVGGSTFYLDSRTNSDDDEGFGTTLVGDSTFYDRYEHFNDIDWAVREALEEEEEEEGRSGGDSLESNAYDILLSPKLDCSLKSSDPSFISVFMGSPLSNNKQQKLRQSVSCSSPKTIELDLFRFRRILKNSYRDFVFSVLSGRPLVVIGNEDDDMSCSFKNALSLFVTCPHRVCPFVVSELQLEDLGKYTLIQCKRNATTIKMVECFAQSGLCSVIHHERRSGKAPKYRGDLIPRIWGEDGSRNSVSFSERTLFSVVQSGLVSELAFELLDKYYSLLLDKECSVEAVLGTSPEEQCDNQIYKFQILLLLNPTSSLLATSHNLSTEFKYY